MLSLAISPCPNDTFVFSSMVHNYALTVDDIESLNRRAEHAEFDITKISVATYPRIQEHYSMLAAGGTAGFGVGPVVVSRGRRKVGGRVAIPGRRTTAALLLRLLGEFDTVPMRFDRIQTAVATGEVDCGVLIHEARFTYGAAGLVKLVDLGEVWWAHTGGPVPLGAIVIRRELGLAVARHVEEEIRASLHHAQHNNNADNEFVQQHAAKMLPSVIRQHIDLYVNRYTFQYDEVCVQRLLALNEFAPR